MDLDVPRDRNGTFEPQPVRKGQRRLDGIDKLVIGLYAPRHDGPRHPGAAQETFDLDVSPDLISKITDSVLEEVQEWQSRPLDPVYPVIFLDALICKVRDDGTVRTRRRTWPSASTPTATRRSWASGSRPPRAPSSGCG